MTCCVQRTIVWTVSGRCPLCERGYFRTLAGKPTPKKKLQCEKCKQLFEIGKIDKRMAVK